MDYFYNLKTFLNSLGLILTMAGVYLVFINSPVNEHTIDGGNAFTDSHKLIKETVVKNKRIKYGIYIILFGTTFQLVSNYIY